jgi:DNA-binding NarL/FixJ family response regulator
VKPRVLIADDHPPTRAGVRAALREEFEICGEAASASDTVQLALKELPDVCLIDVHMPGGGVAAAAEITSKLPTTAVVMLTISQHDDDLFAALSAGAVGYLLKGIDPARLPLALLGVLQGEAAVPRSLVARVLAELRDQSARRRLPMVGQRPVTLTNREWQVLDLLRDGLTTKEIASRLFIASVTVRTHVSSILRKLDVSDRDAAIRLVSAPNRGAALPNGDERTPAGSG